MFATFILRKLMFVSIGMIEFHKLIISYIVLELSPSSDAPPPFLDPFFFALIAVLKFFFCVLRTHLHAL